MTESHRQGSLGELLACTFLQMCGYTLLCSGYRIGGAEIDLIMRKRDQIAFVEVKTRSAEGPAEAEQCFSQAQLKRMRTAARHWIHHQEGPAKWYTFDVVTVKYSTQWGTVQVQHYPSVG